LRVTFWSARKPREIALAKAMVAGLSAHGVAFKVRWTNEEPELSDIACMFGVKSKRLFDMHREAGRQVIFFDKGYSGNRRDMYRVSVNQHHPISFLAQTDCPGNRWEAIGIEPKPWDYRGGSILYAGSSAKYHDFNDIMEPTQYAQGVIDEIRGHSNRPIVYRPKPSWNDAVPVRGAEFSATKSESLKDLLSQSNVMVTHGSNACFEAVCEGTPSIVLGDGIGKTISSTSIADVDSPYMASDKKRLRWLQNLAYCQWSLSEISSGMAWSVIAPQLKEL